MTSTLEKSLAAELASWESAGRRRTLDEVPRPRVDLGSNDYLGLAGHPEVIEAARAALATHGAGGRAARLLGGGSPLATEAEAAAADWLRAEAALLFPTGYQANLGVVGALAGRGDAVFSDALNHASLIDAARLSRARVRVHAHLDLDELGRNLARASGARRRLVLAEGVYSMDGDASPLAEIVALCEEHDAWLVVDEAHAAGLLGPEGQGACAAAGSAVTGSERLLARVVTGGKALGVAGAFAICSKLLREQLLNRARSFVFTTAPPPATAGALVRAIALCRGADADRERTLGLARRLAERLDLPRPAAAIVPVRLGDDRRAVEAAGELRAAGFDLGAVRPPTVPEGTARLRVACHAFNTEQELDRLADLLEAPASRPAPIAVAPRLATPLVVCGTDTGIGKTVVSALLVRAGGDRAAYWKPVQTGDDDDTAEVARLADRPRELEPGHWYAKPASPHEAAEAEGAAPPDPDALTATWRAHRSAVAERGADLLVAELAGGLLVPLRLGFTQAEWLERTAPPLVLVARSGLGTLNHTLLSLEALRARHLEPRALFLVGPPHAENRATLESMAFVPRILELPPLEPLDTAALDRWLAANDLSDLLEA